MSNETQCFFAYPNNPPALAETIEQSIRDINSDGAAYVHVQGWKDLAVSGKPIVEEICKAIDRCDLFLCDLTNLNPNVLFELGYAIAKNKRVWISLDDSFRYAHDNYSRFSLITTIGYSKYHNARELVNRFFTDSPFNDLNSTVFNTVIRELLQAPDRPIGVFYLKSAVNTEASVRLSERLKKAGIPLIVDDPEENISQPLTWYAMNAFASSGTIAHFLDEARGVDTLQNAKHSFVSGLVYGFERYLLMLAHAPFSSPLDYRDLLRIHSTASECQVFFDEWLPRVKDAFRDKQKQQAQRLKEIDRAAVLARVSFGQDIAENEQEPLRDYFVETVAYSEALKGPPTRIYVGRKGTGKTANFYAVANKMQADPRNHVCLIKPISYELEGILELMHRAQSRADQGYLVQSLWKFLIYTEIGNSLYHEIMSRPVHYEATPAEKEFVEFVGRYSNLLLTDFAVRMERAIADLADVELIGLASQTQPKVSERLHTGFLGELRAKLGKALEKRRRVFVLIDNLDKAWDRQADLPQLSDFLFGLLSVSRSVTEEFQRTGSTWRSVSLSLLIYLRSDIFAYVMSVARERDKLSSTTIHWEDPDLLRRVITERMLSSSNITEEDVWSDVFEPEVEGKPIQEYLIAAVIPRPRDLIYLCNAALANAINLRHVRIQEIDILKAQRDYSQYVFNSLEAEMSAQIAGMESFLFEFVGANAILMKGDVVSFARKAGILEDQIESAIDLLIDTAFLGIERNPDSFEYLYDETRKPVLRSLARKTIEQTGEERFEINLPYRAFLEIVPTG